MSDAPYTGPPPITNGPFSPELLAVLDAPDSTEVTVVDGEPSSFKPGTFRRHIVRLRAVVIDDAGRREVGAAVASALVTPAQAASCFDPHHAVRLVRGGIAVDLVICFMCGKAQVWGPGQRGRIVMFSEAGEPPCRPVLAAQLRRVAGLRDRLRLRRHM